jgi:mannosyl-oligosaccharide alpha-1,2-mannosidase
MLEHICKHCVCRSCSYILPYQRLQLTNYYKLLYRTGIGPEVFAFTSSEGAFTGGSPPTPEQIAFNQEHGFYITAADYIFRPEVLESNFYAWRVTGDTKYLDRAASAVKSFNQYLAIKDAFAGLENVNTVNSDKIDDMESFWFAEVLKYLCAAFQHLGGPRLMFFRYLTFDDPTHISLDECELSYFSIHLRLQDTDYCFYSDVFNTEAHPFKIPAPKASYGSSGTITHQPTPFKVNDGPLPAISSSPAMPKPLKVGDLLRGIR